MEQDNAKYWELARKQFQEKASDEERKMLSDWAAAHPENQAAFDDYRKLFEATEYPIGTDAFDPLKDWGMVSEALDETSSITIKPEKHQKTRTLTLRTIMRVAAAIILIVGFIAVFDRETPYSDSDQTEMQVFQTNSKQKDFVVLPDHSTVWLNKDSKLLYPEAFNGNDRTVYLTGEAYFDVETDTEKPFIIYSGLAKTEVLGTSFNLRAYANEPEVQLTVVTGKVAFSLKTQQQAKAVMVRPGTLAVLGKNKRITLGAADQNMLAWKTNHLVFDNAPMPGMIATLNGYYTVTIKMENPSIQNCRFTGDFKDMPLKNALAVITEATGLHYRQENGVYVLYGQGCKDN